MYCVYSPYCLILSPRRKRKAIEYRRSIGGGNQARLFPNRLALAVDGVSLVYDADSLKRGILDYYSCRSLTTTYNRLRKLGARFSKKACRPSCASVD
jgi:hypothetical protein